jgi:hypothetical protein
MNKIRFGFLRAAVAAKTFRVFVTRNLFQHKLEVGFYGKFVDDEGHERNWSLSSIDSFQKASV